MSAFVMYFIGCTSVYIVCAASFERYYTIKNATSFKKLSNKFYLVTSFACVALGFFWASAPLFGWSRYSLEDLETSCSVEWRERSLSVTV
jgi:hypothetical protein